MKKYYDISVSVSSELPIWPGSQEIRFKRTLDLDQGDIANETAISFSVHTGTHVDAPLHFIPNGNTVDQLHIENLIGEVLVIDVGEAEVITSQLLESLDIPVGTKRLIFKTKNSKLWNSRTDFDPNFVAITADAAEWVVNREIVLVGIDYLSIQRFYDSSDTHIILLKSNVIIIEGLNLSEVPAGNYELICLPIKLKGVEGAPARVILRSLSSI